MNTNSSLPSLAAAARASLFPAWSTIALKLLCCPHVQAASKSCLKMARYDEKHLIMAPKIHRPRIALHSWGKKRSRRPRTECLPPYVRSRGKFHHLLTNSQAMIALQVSPSWTFSRLDWHPILWASDGSGLEIALTLQKMVTAVVTLQ